MGVDKHARDVWQFGRSRIELLSEEESAEIRRRMVPVKGPGETVPHPPFGMPDIPAKGPYEMQHPLYPGGEKREDEFMDTVPGLDPRCRAKR